MLHSSRVGADGTHGSADWEALVRSRLTLVIYMGIANASCIRARLQDAGMAGATPVAIVANATRADQRAIVATLRDFVEVARDANVASPAIIVVGDVAALGHPLDAYAGDFEPVCEPTSRELSA